MLFSSVIYRLRGQIIALKPRERILLVAVLFSGFIYVSMGLIAQQQTRLGVLNQELRNKESELVNVRKAIDGTGKSLENEISLARTELDLQEQRFNLWNDLQSQSGPSHKQLIDFLRRSVAEHRSVKLVSFKTTAPVLVYSPSMGASAGNKNSGPASGSASAQASPVVNGAAQNAPQQVNKLSADIYQHGLQIEISGKYLDIMNYLLAIEAGDLRLHWSEAKIKSTSFPMVSLMVTVYIFNHEPTAQLS